SEAQVRAAQEKADALQKDAERKHTEIMTTVKKQQSALESRIEELRTYEREYRTRLKTFLESQLEELNSRSTAAPNSNIDFGEK
ncbi:MAG: cell division protein, partial [Corynebacterium sp.]|nr:cell division protein [Corynebacterium sp.]